MNTAALLWASPFLAHAGTILPDGVQQKVLDNGLTVVALPLPSDLVALQIWADVGSRHEVAAGTTGYAHFFEHLMFRGSENVSASAREERMLQLSAVDNAWTSTDHTCYHAIAPADRLASLLDLEADRFQHLALTPASVEQESGAVMGEFRKGASSPGTLLYETLYATAYTTHTYQHSTIGYEQDVLAMASGYDIAQRFYADHYRPDRTTVVIAGGIDPQVAIAAVEERMGGWAPAEVEPLPIPTEPAQAETRRAHIDWEGGATQPRVVLAWKGPAYDPASADSAALGLIEAMLSSETAPLHQALVKDKQLAWSLWSEAPAQVDPGLLTVAVRLRDGVAPEAVEAEVEAAIAALRAVSPETLAETQAWARRRLLLSLDDPAGWASQVGWYAAQGFGPEGIEQHLDALMALQPADIQAAIDHWLVPGHKTVVTLSAVESP